MEKIYFPESPSGRESGREKITMGIASSVLFVCTLFIFGPIKMYAGNADALWFPLSAILPMLLIIALGVFFVLLAVIYFLPVLFSRFVSALVFGLGIAFYIEGTFMPMDYGLLDGRTVDWGKYADRIFYDSMAWLLCIVLPLVLLVWKRNLFKKLVPMVCFIVILTQVVGMAIVLFDLPGKSTSDYLTDEGKFTLGKEENIMVIVLDLVDRRMFERSLNHSKELADSFKDFILYENSMSAFKYTEPAIPAILTGAAYDNSIPFNEYIYSAYEKYPLLENLFNAGYDSRLFTFQNLIPMNNKKINAYIANKNKIDKQMKVGLTNIMYQFTLMRYVPVYFKNIFWLPYDAFEKVKSKKMDFTNRGKGINTDLTFYRQLKRDGLTAIEGKAFRFYHFQGAHDFLNMDRNLKMVKGYKDDDLARLDQAEGSLKITAAFLQAIKNAGVYENSTVIITGDHGAGGDPTMAYYLAPVMLIKNKNSNSISIGKSSAPVMNSDIAATIMEIVRPDNKYGGIAIDKINEHTHRTRKHYFYNGYASAKKGYVPNMIEFIDQNHTVLPQDFKKSGNILSADGIVKHTYKYYPLGKLLRSEDITHDWNIRKGDKEFYGECAVLGESDWNSGDVFKTAGMYSTLGFSLSATGQELPVTLMVASAFEKNIPQRLFIEVNGSKLADEFLFNNRNFEMVKFNIPKGVIKKDGFLTLTLFTPDARQIRDPFERLLYFKEALVIKSIVIGKAYFKQMPL